MHMREKQREKRNIIAQASGKSVLDISRNKGKLASTSSVAQTKTNAQKREGSALSCNNKTFVRQKEKNGATKTYVPKLQPDAQRTVNKGASANVRKTVLQQNNQKQNCKDNPDLNNSTPNLQRRKGVNGVVSKVVVDSEISSASRKAGLGLTRIEKEMSLSRRKTSARDRKAVNADCQGSVSDNGRSGISVKCNVEFAGDLDHGTGKQKKDMDVISFTFSSPIRGLASESQTSAHEIEKDIGPYHKNLNFTSRFNLIGSDVLNSILEQKLMELTSKVESSTCNGILEEASVFTSRPRQDKQFQQSLDREAPEGLYEPDQTSFDDQGRMLKHKFQVVESIDSECNGIKESADLHASLASGPSSSGSCLDHVSDTDGGKSSFFPQDQSSLSWESLNESQPAQDETEFSESASTISMGTCGYIYSKEPSDWELEYIRDILNHGDILVEEFALGQTQKIITPNLFDQLENQAARTEVNNEENPKLVRKVLFDCIHACLELRSEQLVTGGVKALAKHITLFQKKEFLAQDLYKEIVSWKNMEEFMVDELVDKDMSSGNGRWLEYDKEALEEGVEIEKLVVNDLVDELVSDLIY